MKKISEEDATSFFYWGGINKLEPALFTRMCSPSCATELLPPPQYDVTGQGECGA